MMKTLFLIALFVGTLSSVEHAYAQSTTGDCANLEDGGQRLLCYDAIFRLKIDTSSAVKNTTSAWSLRTEKNRITDTTDVFASVESTETIPGRFGGPGSKASLLLRCQKNTTSFTVWFGGQFMADSGGYDRVSYRIDDLPAKSDSWEESTNNEHMGLWSGGRAIPMIKSLFGHGNFLLEATPFNENSITLDFNISGVEQAVTELRKACGW